MIPHRGDISILTRHSPTCRRVCNDLKAESLLPEVRELFRLPKRKRRLHKPSAHLSSKLPKCPNRNLKVHRLRSLTNTIRKSHGVQDRQRSVLKLKDHLSVRHRR
jgi:hypothetical protein